MSSYSFWGGFFGGNPIREIMKTKSYTLEDLLKEDAGQFAAAATSDQELIAYLSTPERLTAMFNYVIEEPVRRDDARPEQVVELKRRWAYSASATEAFCQSFSLLSALMADSDRMAALFDALLGSNHALVFHRLAAIVTPMLAAEPEQTIKYIWEHVPRFVERIVERIGTASAQDLIPLLKSLLKAESKLQPAGTWMAQERLIEILVKNLAPGKSDQTYLDTALVLSELLIDSAMANAMSAADSDSFEDLDELGHGTSPDGDEDTRDEMRPKRERPPLSPLVLQFSEASTLDLFFSTVLSSTRALTPALAFLRAYLTVTAQEGMQQEAIIAKIVERLSALIDQLKPEPEPRRINLPSGPAVSFGLQRLAVLEFLLALNRINNPTLDAAFQEHRFFNLLLDILFRQSTSSIVHDLIAQAFFAAFNRPESYIHSVIQSTDLMQVILDKWAYYEKANAIERDLQDKYPDLLPLRYLTHVSSLDKFPEEIRDQVAIVREVRAWSFVGHLANLANLVAGLAKHGEGELKSYIESNNQWTSFVDGELKDYNARANVAHAPSQWSIDSESNEHGHHDDDDDDDEGDEDDDSDDEREYGDDDEDDDVAYPHPHQRHHQHLHHLRRVDDDDDDDDARDERDDYDDADPNGHDADDDGDEIDLVEEYNAQEDDEPQSYEGLI